MHDTNTASFAHSSTLADVLKDPKQDCFEIRFFPKSLNQFRFKVPPALLKIITNKHAAKILP